MLHTGQGWATHCRRRPAPKIHALQAEESRHMLELQNQTALAFNGSHVCRVPGCQPQPGDPGRLGAGLTLG